MMVLGKLLILITLAFSSISHAQTSAENELSQLNFFSDGQGMHLSPGILDKLEWVRNLLEGTQTDKDILKLLSRRWGIQSENQKLIGIQTIRYRGLKIGVLGCVACHSGKAAGQYIIGIGNKNIDPGQIGMDGVLIEKAAKALHPLSPLFHPHRKAIEESSIKLMKKLADPRLSASTQGLVPVSLVGSWFFEQAGAALPKNGYKGAVKVPAWFGFGTESRCR